MLLGMEDFFFLTVFFFGFLARVCLGDLRFCGVLRGFGGFFAVDCFFNSFKTRVVTLAIMLSRSSCEVLL